MFVLMLSEPRITVVSLVCVDADFDEQTADDWDVDMSEYYEPGTGDKDAKDYIRMRAEDRLRGGIAHLEEISAFDNPIGSFEHHTKVNVWSQLLCERTLDNYIYGVLSKVNRANYCDQHYSHCYT